MSSLVQWTRLVVSHTAFPRGSGSLQFVSKRSFGCGSNPHSSKHSSTAFRPRVSAAKNQPPPPPPTPAVPSFVTKGKSPAVKQAEERIPWPVSNRGSYFASLGSDSEVAQPKASDKPNQTPKEAVDALIADFNDLKRLNPYMVIEVNNGGKEMVLRLPNKPDVSFFRVVAVDENQLGFECPSSPGYLRKYKRNEFGEWNDTMDGHNLHGLFVRDLLPHIQGVPRFASG